MNTYRITIDQSLCSGFGTCVENAASVFSLDRGVVSTRADESDDAGVLEAAASCPMGAIAVYDSVTGGQVA